MNSSSIVYVSKIESYDSDNINKSIPEHLFDIIYPGDKVVIKPNWVLESHSDKTEEWEYVITHPKLLDVVIQIVIAKLMNSGSIILTDGPELNANFNKILSHYPIEKWRADIIKSGINFEIIDLRDVYYIQDKNVTIKKIPLSSDPNGKVLFNLQLDQSEFFRHKKSKTGYFGGGSDFKKTNEAHNGSNNFYSLSRTAIESDVFINIPKLKTHKKAGITASLKNLVGINTDRSLLPHHTIGNLDEDGDQFPEKKLSSSIEKSIMPLIHQNILRIPLLARFFSPLFTFAKWLFGDNTKTIRAGAWFGNDTLWRTILDINKLLFYGRGNSTLKSDLFIERKRYITIVDGIWAGQGNGPKAPDKIELNAIISGLNPVAVDYVCAYLMNFDPIKIPSIANGFKISKLKLCDFNSSDIRVFYENKDYFVKDIPVELIRNFSPHMGWCNYLERRNESK